ncbi:MAG: hypothetical protein KF808_07535 [Cryobacterium sp.]|nr:hypothetical protein [Cryobacterium sp.]
MTEPQSLGQPKPQPFTKGILVALAGTVIFGALLVAVDGVLSLVLDLDVVTETDAGPLIGPLMAVVALAVVFFAILIAMRPAARKANLSVAAALVGAILVYLLGPISGAVLYFIAREQLAAGALFLAKYLSSPFVLASAALAFVVILVLPPLSRVGARAQG